MSMYIVIGLGNFGSTLASELTVQGNEVMAVDRTMSKVEAIKDQVTHAICMDAADPVALQSLPVKEAEAVIVSIGEDVGASAWSLRMQYRPLIRFIWFGALLMAFGGVIAILDRRLRAAPTAAAP